MRERLTRVHHADLEIRSAGDGRTVAGIAVPFGKPARIYERGMDFSESFHRGAFARTIAERGHRVKFLAQHQYDTLPLGRAVVLREDAVGLYGEFRVSKTTAGDEVLELIRDGALDAFSIGFTPVPARDQWSADRTSVVRTEVRLNEVSVVTFPAYADALITSVRADDPTHSVELARRRLDLLTRGW